MSEMQENLTEALEHLTCTLLRDAPSASKLLQKDGDCVELSPEAFEHLALISTRLYAFVQMARYGDLAEHLLISPHEKAKVKARVRDLLLNSDMSESEAITKVVCLTLTCVLEGL